MSTGQLSRQRSTSRASDRSARPRQPPTPSVTPKIDEQFEPCAATAAFFLYAQRAIILCLHHDTLAIERRFERHREDVLWISADNVSERGTGRLVVSYDVGSTAIVWDLFTGQEVARFASYEQIRVAAWMKNGNVAFGNAQGNVILFEPSTSEHISARTIFDPITALAPAADCRTYAIGYQNGSILIAALQPSFTILHTLTSPKAPSPITALSWHGSSSKQKSEMLATQTADGDLRVWSVAKAPQTDPPSVIRILNRSESVTPGLCWFAWSKNGRIVQYSEGQTWVWDVRTKKVAYMIVPTLDAVTAIANYGPTATLFTLGRNHTVQQYDLNPNNTPMLVANVQHVPPNAPPSPPNSIEEQKEQQATANLTLSAAAPELPDFTETESSEGEGATMSPLQRIAQEMDQLEEERRDLVGPLSPVSSRSSVSSRESGGRMRSQPRYDRTFSSRTSNDSLSDRTVFSSGSSIGTGRDSISIRSMSSTASSKYKSSSLRKEILQSPAGTKPPVALDLFPSVKARLSDVPFRTPQYGPQRTTDDLRQQMLSVVFGWDDDIESLVRDELSQHTPGSASAVLLSKWLGDLGANDVMASMIGSESMTSSDWMLLALSAMGPDSQKKVGEAFVQRLLEKGDVHPAVAILLGLGEINDAVEVYVSQNYNLEAVLLTCLFFRSDWQRQSHLVRKWGEIAVGQGQPQLAVRCFSCTGLESSEPWFSPRAQDEVLATQQQQNLSSQLSPPLSPPSAGHSRLTAKNASLKLITSFGNQGAAPIPSTTDERTPMLGVGVTPIAESAISPSGPHPWGRASERSVRDPSSARTATPGAYGRRRLPSRGGSERSNLTEATPLARPRHLTPQTAIDTAGRDADITLSSHSRSLSQHDDKEQLVTLNAVAFDPRAVKKSDALPSPAPGMFTKLQEQSRARNGSRDRKPDGLELRVDEVLITEGAPATSGTDPPSSAFSLPLTDASLASAKIRGIDQYISSLEEANFHARQQRAESRPRGEGRDGRSRSRPALREQSENRGRSGVRYIRPAKRSPSSPVPMSPEDAGLYNTTTESNDDELYYKVTSPIGSGSESATARAQSRSRTAASKVRSGSKTSRRLDSPERVSRSKPGSRAASRAASRYGSPERSGADERDRTELRAEGLHTRSPSPPLPSSDQARLYTDEEDGDTRDDRSIGARQLRPRQRSTSRRPGERARSSQREASPERHGEKERSRSRRPTQRRPSVRFDSREESPERTASRVSSRSHMPKMQVDAPQTRQPRGLTKKELAARELEQRRLSLARRPSAPVIPHPGELSAGRPGLGARSVTELGNNPASFLPPLSGGSEHGISRSQSVDPEAMTRYGPKSTSGTSTFSTPIGLPATPRAMRHPRYMSTDPNEREAIPAVPEIPDHIIHITAEVVPADEVAPLLPSTVFGQVGPQAPLPRSASAPPDHGAGFPSHSAYRSSQRSRQGSISSRGHSRKLSPNEISSVGSVAKRSPPPITASIDETLHDSQVVIIEDKQDAPPLLAELQHLNGPPPPPPPPVMFRPTQQSAPHSTSGHSSTGSLEVINIAIDDHPRTTSPLAVMTGPPPSTSPNMHRRGRGSVSDNIGSRLRSVTERMRSTSRSRAKSPPIEGYVPSPYETVLPPNPYTRHPGNSQTTAPAPPEILSHLSYESIPPPPPPPPPPPAGGFGAPLVEVVIPPDNAGKANNAFAGYRNPKEIRANMPPEQVQMGVAPMESPTGMI
ncbi:hypothetical protein H2201_002436 [Coniosporium apollinis]|uniref:Gem-associated protein 5 TPR domain-containing protein n=1 Tax=Coniosporium apollinis TaxID=61459 RepID=A0ABQ9P5A2_9PEZI|nr:hypothetical protein H2201_002436 [Coniosporium apollinis]